MAEIKTNVDTNRQNLADIIPLPAPFTVYIEQTRVCNIKCYYCIHSTRDDKNSEFNKLGYEVKHMPSDDYKKVIGELATFPSGSIKRIVFSGLGEPLANPLLPDFVKIAADSKISDRVEIITNGLLLNNELSLKLIKSGITNINISVQGINSKQYEKTCGKKIDLNKFLDTLKYLYKIKGKAQIYIKAIDAAFKKDTDKDEFLKIFSPFADKIYVEHIVQMQQQHDKILDQVTASKNMYGEECSADRKVCGQCFYFLQVGCDLDLFPCSIPGLRKGFSVGNLNKNSILDIWNGKKRMSFLKMMLKLEKDKMPECKTCVCYNVITDESEYLDDKTPELLINIFGRNEHV
ncbi:MAG: radical SAM/SPASM domain-containing protein [Proteobacteria bacterium]|nr:radical SAM/SPASM domain-containing protein [Pseudomonadota bacterium]